MNLANFECYSDQLCTNAQTLFQIAGGAVEYALASTTCYIGSAVIGATIISIIINYGVVSSEVMAIFLSTVALLVGGSSILCCTVSLVVCVPTIFLTVVLPILGVGMLLTAEGLKSTKNALEFANQLAWA